MVEGAQATDTDEIEGDTGAGLPLATVVLPPLVPPPQAAAVSRIALTIRRDRR
jgi:hypothetical protein